MPHRQELDIILLYFIFAARRSGTYIVHQDLLLIDSQENKHKRTNFTAPKHTANINQIDINSTLLH